MRLLLWLFLFFPATSVFAAPACYEQASVPAHSFAFAPSETLVEVTGLTPDGTGCISIPFWKGAPVFEQKIHAPFRQVYEAYATAIERNDRTAAQSLYTWLRPTPRTFPVWAELFSVEDGPPLPWGMATAVKILRLLQPDPYFESNLLIPGDSSMPVLNMRLAWPMFFLLMGGEIYPSETWVNPSFQPKIIQRGLGWRYPSYAMETRQISPKSIQLRVR